jgi:F-type H+-transporting ATPase subunit gamma
MATLKETKSRIESVKGTLKITSAMKLVASSKLRKAQTTIENLLPYELKLRGLMLSLASSSSQLASTPLLAGGERSDAAQNAPVAVAAVASNSSLCGAFNSNVIRETLHRLSSLKAEGREVVLFCVGRKMADAMKRNGYEVTTGDWSDLVAKADYEGCCSLADTLTKGYLEGRYSRVELVYNHFVSSARQEVRYETYLPLSLDSLGDSSSSSDSVAVDPILEPSPAELFEALLPRALKLNIYTVMLDSQAAEHAARTVAMQMATDNGQQMLSDLTLEYNKARQSKITSEILDIVGGSLQ